jgi:hypothetical protein
MIIHCFWLAHANLAIAKLGFYLLHADFAIVIVCFVLDVKL